VTPSDATLIATPTSSITSSALGNPIIRTPSSQESSPVFSSSPSNIGVANQPSTSLTIRISGIKKKLSPESYEDRVGTPVVIKLSSELNLWGVTESIAIQEPGMKKILYS
jgi:hypothetical protein